MSAMFVGRVGGLAVALGIGAAAFNAAGLAVAESGASDQAATGTRSSAASEHQKPASAPSGVARQRVARGSSSAAPTGHSDSSPAASVATRVRPQARVAEAVADRASVNAATDPSPADVTPKESAAAVQNSAPVPTAALAVAPTVSVPTPASTVADPTPAPANEALATVALADLVGGGSPTAPIDSPIEWAGLAVARRGVAGPKAASVAQPAPVAAAVSFPSYTQGACTQSSAACVYIMGASGVPIPGPAYTPNVMSLYVQPNYPTTDYTTQTVWYPAGAYPVTGIKVLPLTISAAQGQTILEQTVNILQPGTEGQTTVPITFFGFSQSAVIGSLLQRSLTDPKVLPGVDRSQINFVTVGQEMNPNGGWFARFPGFNIPSAGEYFFGSTPEDAFPVTNYTLEYDGFADSPRYPLNFISALNAAMGILLIHPNYTNPKYFSTTYGTLGNPGIDPVMGMNGPGVACGDGSGSSTCISLPTTSETQKYYFIQTPNLPLLAPIRAIPLIGKPLAALIQPVLKVIVDLGYGDPAHGFTSATQPDANVPVPFGLFPQVSPVEVLQQLADGVVQGVKDFFGELGPSGSLATELSSIGSNLSKLSAKPMAFPTTPDQLLTSVQALVTNVGVRISAGASALYASLLSTADFVNAALVALPTYDFVLFVDGIKQAIGGQPIPGLINSIGRPIAADVGMAATIIVLQLAAWLEGVFAAVTGCGPAAPTTGLCVIPGVGP